MIGRVGLGAVLVWSVVAGVASSARAGDPLGEIVANASTAPLAVVGEAIRQESRWENGGIWTYTEFAVRRSVGEAVPSMILVRERGGEVDGIGQRVTHARRLDATRPHLLLLWRDPETGAWLPGIGGILPLAITPSGETVEGVDLESVLGALAGVIR
jgi:hypothetical protein